MSFLVTFFYLSGDEPFICEVQGKATVSVLTAIELEAIQNVEDQFTLGDGEYTFVANWFGGQFDEIGNCEIAPGWDTDLTAFVEVDLSETTEPDQ